MGVSISTKPSSSSSSTVVVVVVVVIVVHVEVVAPTRHPTYSYRPNDNVGLYKTAEKARNSCIRKKLLILLANAPDSSKDLGAI